jgi:hypothetical protein
VGVIKLIKLAGAFGNLHITREAKYSLGLHELETGFTRAWFTTLSSTTGIHCLMASGPHS